MIFVIFLFSILIHELSHILIGLIFGYKLKNFRFIPFGAVIEFKELKKSKSEILKNLLIYFSGPLSNFIICYFAYITNYQISKDILYTNLILGIFNLLPLTPLDGGKILKELLKLVFSHKMSNIISYKITKFFLCLFTFLYSIFIIKLKNISLLIILVYLWYIDIIESKKIATLKKVYRLIEKSNFKY